MNIKVVDQNQDVNVEPQELTEPVSEVMPDGVLLEQQIAQMFDLKPSEISRYSKQLNGLIEYAKLKSDSHDAANLKWAIRSLSVKVGTPPLGEKLLPYLYRYAYLYLESRKIEAEKEKFLRGESDE